MHLKFLLPFLALATAAHADDNWNRFRGPLGIGLTTESQLPTKWDSETVTWKVTLKGEGQSQPVNWGHRLFLTSANKDGTERYVTCLDKSNGSVLWEKTIPCKTPERNHKMNSWASASCATDGARVVAFFGPAGLHCFDMEGNPKWSRDLGQFPGTWGVGASPIILDDLVIQNCDAEGESFLEAFNKETGETVWKTPRGVIPKGGWSTPYLITAGSQPQMILTGEFGVDSYHPKTGEKLWFCKSFGGRGEPVPYYADGVLYVVNGQSPGVLYAVRTDGKGDVTATHMLWNTRRSGGRDLPSPVVVDNFVIVSSLSGIVSCYDTKTGETLYTERLSTRQITASPIVADGLVYMLNEEGVTFVIKPGVALEVVAENRLTTNPDEIFRASMSPIQGQIFARSQNVLYCLGKAPAKL